mmetsp:Transcript_1273/g.3248  ORF Transcript_1273/g.3248 Transcript_1273/m.3248 type:complete len:224 (+) Transcript_1273:269-940(+)
MKREKDSPLANDNRQAEADKPPPRTQPNDKERDIEAPDSRNETTLKNDNDEKQLAMIEDFGHDSEGVVEIPEKASASSSSSSRFVHNTCTICLCGYRVGDTIVWSESCDHAFHLSCLDKWWLAAKHTGQCPICRGRFVNDKLSDPTEEESATTDAQQSSSPPTEATATTTTNEETSPSLSSVNDEQVPTTSISEQVASTPPEPTTVSSDTDATSSSGLATNEP